MVNTPELPESFSRSMSQWMASEWPDLKYALTESDAVRALRLHRWTVETTQITQTVQADEPVYAINLPVAAPPALLSKGLEPVSWAPDCFYLPPQSRWGNTVWHEAGAFYLQEASAMAVVSALDPLPGERVLDLCAAPGGKTTAIGRLLGTTGLLVANDIHPQRVTVLAQNVERMGVLAMIANESPQRLAHSWPAQFDAVLVDAPCSGEGMFRKDPDARQVWTPDAPERCAVRQQDILTEAVRLTRVGGRIVYSTCTLNPLENEAVIAWALSELPVEVEPLPLWTGWSEGRPEWAGDVKPLQWTRRLWPHIGRGEGHFVARLRVVGALPATDCATSSSATPRRPSVDRKTPSTRRTADRAKGPTRTPPDALTTQQIWLEWACAKVARDVPNDWRDPILRGNVLFTNQAVDLPSQGLRILRPGLPLAEIRRGRLVPHHALAMALHTETMRSSCELDAAQAAAFLSGATLPVASSDRGWHWIQTNSLPLGWGKAADGRLNNYYPKGLRKVHLGVGPTDRQSPLFTQSYE